MLASNKWAAAAVVVLCSLAPTAAQDTEVAAAPEADVVRVKVDLVTINVSVFGSGKRPVVGLRAEDFLVSDEGRPVNLEFFDDPGPSSIVFLVDTSESMKHEKWKPLAAGLRKFLARAREGSDYTLVAFGDRPRLVAEGVSAGELWERFGGLELDGGTALYDAVLAGLEALGRAPRRRKALVLLSDGQDNRSRATLEDVRREALARRATIYTVGIFRRDIYPHPPLRKDEREGKEILNQLAAATGGLAFFPRPSELGKVLDGVNDDLAGQYTLGYYAPAEGPGWRSVSVSLPADPRPLRLRYQERYLKR